ncbi:uncharacterized protein BDV14DRAFT_185652 [Aspergillus stella-maris]|uniref:uncharacterized protein n=1 Tax=Aspergillus stella-maris TaxID=1810926 RepID=UPI003CCCC0AE
MTQYRISDADVYLLDQWQENSPPSVEAQREQIFTRYISLGARGREPYSPDQKGPLTPHEHEILNHARQPLAERKISDSTPWLRTYYASSPEASITWENIQEEAASKTIGQPIFYDDESLYNFGKEWSRIFMRAPQLLQYRGSVDEREEDIATSLNEAIEGQNLDPERAKEEGYDPDEDTCPWPTFYNNYHLYLVIRRLNVVDEVTLSPVLKREGRKDAGKVKVVWFDECGRTVRYSRESVLQAAECVNLSNGEMDDYGCWVNARIGREYLWGESLGPPYGVNG